MFSKGAIMANATPNAKGLQETAGTVADKTKEVAGTVADKAKDFASQAADRAKDFGKSASHAAETATAKVGSGVETVADKLREKAPREGMVHDAAFKVADSLEKSGRYLQEEGLSGMADDLTGVIRRNPIPAVLVGIGIGYLIAHALRR
jgi:hypothetical protein